MEYRILDLIATVMAARAGPPGRRRRGHPPAAPVRVLAASRRCARAGRGHAVVGPAGDGGASRRRDPAPAAVRREWARAGDLLQRAHAVPAALLRAAAVRTS